MADNELKRLIHAITKLMDTGCNAGVASHLKQGAEWLRWVAETRAAVADMPRASDMQPQHSTECIDTRRAALTIEEFRGVCKDKAFKYVELAAPKGSDQSLQKAIWYLSELHSEREIKKAFEKWAKNSKLITAKYRKGGYFYANTSLAWRAWKAAIAFQKEKHAVEMLAPMPVAAQQPESKEAKA